MAKQINILSEEVVTTKTTVMEYCGITFNIIETNKSGLATTRFVIQKKDRFNIVFTEKDVDFSNTNPFTDRNKELHTYSIEITELDQLIELIDNKQYFLADYGRHLLFDHEENIIPLPVNVNYIGSIFTNKYLDLNKTITWLKEQDWVLNKEDLDIHLIPSYNVYDEEDQYVHVTILPPQKILQDLYESYKDENGEIDEDTYVDMKKYYSSLLTEDYDPLNILINRK